MSLEVNWLGLELSSLLVEHPLYESGIQNDTVVDKIGTIRLHNKNNVFNQDNTNSILNDIDWIGTRITINKSPPMI